MAYISQSLRDTVAMTAGYRCGYCLTSQLISGAQLQIEHIIPLAAGGSSDESNLWLACALCNSYKGSRTHAVDPLSRQEVLLFNPRVQSWKGHFDWDEEQIRIVGITPTGRATVEALRLNNDFIVPARRLWKSAGWHPPAE